MTVLNDARDAAIIADVSVSVAAGEVIGIIGPSGAGKSTLARVIAGALQPHRGRLRIDGADMSDWDPERLARHIGYLPQEPSLFAGTVKENIARFHGDLDTEDGTAIEAADRARALVQHLPDGFDHRLKPGGQSLSAGQAQRIALARAMFGNPAVLVLDEPNAHLDAEGDAALLAAIEHYKKAGHTILVVSHKLGILPVIDKLLLMRAGRVEMFGPRDDVMQRIAPTRPRVVASSSVANG